MQRIPLALLALLVCLGARSDAPPSKRIAWFRGSFDGALELARKRNLPLMFVFLTDGEDSSEILTEDVFRDAAVIKASRQTVPILCCTGDHGSRRERQGKRRVSVCKKHGSVTCEQHQSFHTKAYGLIFAGGVMNTPTIRLCHPGRPDDDELATLAETVDSPAAAPTRLAIRKAVRTMGPGISESAFKAVQESLTRARNERRKGGILAAWKRLEGISGVAPKSYLATIVEREKKEIVEEVKASLSRAAKAGLLDYAVALTSVSSDFTGTPLATDAKLSLKKLGKTPAGREALKQARRDSKFRKDLARARTYEEKGRWEKAIRGYLRVSARAKDLPSGREARARLAAMEKDPGLAKRVAAVREKESAKRKK